MSMTLRAAWRGFILADTTLAAKVAKVFPDVVPQDFGGHYCAVTKVISSVAWAKLDGATDQTATRIETTFWGIDADECEKLANRFRTIVRNFNGTMGSGGVDLAVFCTYGPRSMYNPDNRFYGSQLDTMAIVDLSTAA